MSSTTTLIGTAPDQIPTNGHLGDLAFQAKENVNILGGSASLSKVDLAGFKKQINHESTFVYVYDTTKDSDGGAWRYNTDASWYNEPLNTQTRGSRREFPSVAVIAVTSERYGIRIYDGDDPSLPLWAEYKYLSWDSGARWISAKNGKIAIAFMALINYSGNGLVVLDFIRDLESGNYNGQYSNFYSGIVPHLLTNLRRSSEYHQGIKNNRREYTLPASGAAGTNPGSAYDVNSVDFLLLPNAPIDPLTNLPIPVMAVATVHGIKFFMPDGITAERLKNQAEMYTMMIKFTGKGTEYIYVHGWGGNNHDTRTVFVEDGYLLNGTALSYSRNSYQTWERPVADFYWGNLTSGMHTVSRFDDTYGGVNLGAFDKFAVGNNYGLTRFNDTFDMYAFITNTYGTGWMPRDTYGCWLSSTDTYPLYKSEILVNGNFSSGTTGWTGSSGGSLSVTSGVLRITNGGTNGRAVSTTFNTVPGRQYVVRATGVARTGSTYRIEARGPELAAQWESGTVDFNFVAVGSVTYIELYAIGTSGQYAEYDNVTVTEAEPDRTRNRVAAEVFGTIKRESVANGADLVGYSNWSADNYIAAPVYSGSFNWGTSDFYISCWSKKDATNVYRRLVSIITPSGSQGDNSSITLKYGAQDNDEGRLYVYQGTAEYSVAGSTINDTSYVSSNINIWHHAVILRRAMVYEFYVNGVLVDVRPSTQSKGSATARLYIGGSPEGGPIGEPATGVSIALVKYGLSAPSARMIAKMYNDEKSLFRENSKCTLYGTTAPVYGIAHDPDTQLLHVGTASGRSTFRGLERTDYNTNYVQYSLSAVNNLVVEE